MKSDVLVHDVFLSAAEADRGVAQAIRRAFEERGLTVFIDAPHRAPGADWEENIRQAMAESRAFVAILSRASLNSPESLMEIGAAQAWGKAIYFLREGSTEIPTFLQKYPAEPLSRLPDVVERVVGSLSPLSEGQIEILKELYRMQDVPSEQLGARPHSLEQLTRRFNQNAQADLSPERVRQELIRLRKRGELPRRKRKIG